MKTYDFFLLTAIIFFAACPVNGQTGSTLKTGDKVPLFTAPDENGNTWSIKDFIGKKTIVIYFYPAAMTSGCTSQACNYRDDQTKFGEKNAIVVGISGDEVENLRLFKQVHNLNFTLLSDKDGTIARQFGVPVSEGGSFEQDVAGKSYLLNRAVTAGRWTFIADKDGDIRYINRSVDATGDSKKVLDVIEELGIH
jgi:peroxiredoxin Q/BCP